MQVQQYQQRLLPPLSSADAPRMNLVCQCSGTTTSSRCCWQDCRHLKGSNQILPSCPLPRVTSGQGNIWKKIQAHSFFMSENICVWVADWRIFRRVLLQHSTSWGLLFTVFRAAPLLKNASLSESKLRELYLDIVQNMRKLFKTCKLVHADLSEFNVL